MFLIRFCRNLTKQDSVDCWVLNRIKPFLLVLTVFGRVLDSKILDRIRIFVWSGRKHPDPKHCFKVTVPLELNNSFRVSTVNLINSHVQGGELYTSIYKCKAVSRHFRQGQAGKKKSLVLPPTVGTPPWSPGYRRCWTQSCTASSRPSCTAGPSPWRSAA